MIIILHHIIYISYEVSTRCVVRGSSVTHLCRVAHQLQLSWEPIIVIVNRIASQLPRRKELSASLDGLRSP